METRGTSSKIRTEFGNGSKNLALGKGVAQIVALYHAEIINTLADRGISEKTFKYGVKRRVANLQYLTEDRIFSLMRGVEKLCYAREGNVRNQLAQRLESAKKMKELLVNDLAKEKSQWLCTRSFFRWLPFRVLIRIKHDIIKVDAIIATLEAALNDLQVTLPVQPTPKKDESKDNVRVMVPDTAKL